jgi:lipid II:glycine glycyltransferase (peptidoglycan interpeptide bridge formation enzyme)
MVIVESKRGPFRVSDIYYPRACELRGLGRSLRSNQIIYVRQASQFYETAGPVVQHQPFRTSLVDLTRGKDELFNELSRTSRTQVRRVERLGDRIEIRRNDGVDSDFLAVYNEFVRLKRHSERLSPRRLQQLKPFLDIFVSYFEGRPLCVHACISDKKLKRAGIMFTASTRLTGTDAPIFVGSVNRWLHWYEMQVYKSEGMEVYDLGGIGSATAQKEAIARFKLSLGGKQVVEHNYMIAKPLGLLAIKLFYALRRLRSPG